MGVSAPGFAAWEGWVDVKRGGPPLEVHLSPGVAVTAKVVVPGALKTGVKARLVPRRDKSDIGGLPLRSACRGTPNPHGDALGLTTSCGSNTSAPTATSSSSNAPASRRRSWQSTCPAPGSTWE